MNFHFPGYEGLDKPPVLVFPTVWVCLDCGFAEFIVPEGELPILAKGPAMFRRLFVKDLNGKFAHCWRVMTQTGEEESLGLHDSLNGWEQLRSSGVLANVAAYTRKECCFYHVQIAILHSQAQFWT